MIAQQNQAMTQMMQTFQKYVMGAGGAAGGAQSVPDHPGRHLANARLDESAFRRLDKFTNKREDWRGWKMHFITTVRECDNTFADCS